MPTKNIPLKQKISQLLQKHDFNDCIKNNFGAESYEIVEKEIYDYVLLQKDLDMEETFYEIVSIVKNWLGKSQLSSHQIEKISHFCEELVGYKNDHLQNLIHDVFVKYDLIGVIEKGFGDDEYDMEEAKLYEYLKMHQNACQKDIFDKLVEIIEDWFGESPLGVGTLNTLKLMTHEIYENRKLG